MAKPGGRRRRPRPHRSAGGKGPGCRRGRRPDRGAWQGPPGAGLRPLPRSQRHGRSERALPPPGRPVSPLHADAIECLRVRRARRCDDGPDRQGAGAREPDRAGPLLQRRLRPLSAASLAESGACG